MNWEKEWKYLTWVLVIFICCVSMPVGLARFDHAVLEAFYLVRWYAREHVILCLLPAFFIAGAIGVFVRQASVLKYLGVGANKVVAYGVAAVSGTLLAVCSCTILPLFASIYRMGAGLGPATAFLYSGPAVNILALVLTAAVLGPQMGLARGIGAVIFSLVIGSAMAFFFRKEEQQKAALPMAGPEQKKTRPLWQTMLYFFSMVAILVCANWGKPQEMSGLWAMIYDMKWPLTAFFGVFFAVILVIWFHLRAWQVALVAVFVVVGAVVWPATPSIAFTIGLVGLGVITACDDGSAGQWFISSWGFSKQILPLLLIGVALAGALLGRVGHEGLIPSQWIETAVGGNSLRANFFASVAGAFMYFATLTEVPILQGLLGSGMGKGPALALLLSGPALSLPNMLVIRNVLGTKKTIVFILLVVLMATCSGMLFGTFF